MPKCSCTGSTCGCSVTADPGSGINVTGTGTAADPFKLSVNPTGLNIGSTIGVQASNTVTLYKTGSGSAGDPLLLQAKVILTAPNGTKYTLQVANGGALSTTTTIA